MSPKSPTPAASASGISRVLAMEPAQKASILCVPTVRSANWSTSHCVVSAFASRCFKVIRFSVSGCAADARPVAVTSADMCSET